MDFDPCRHAAAAELEVSPSRVDFQIVIVSWHRVVTANRTKIKYFRR